MKEEIPSKNTENNLKNIKSIEPVTTKTELEDLSTDRNLIEETDNKRPDIEMKMPPSTPKRPNSSLMTKLPTQK